MSLTKVQTLLASIYTNSKLRDDFLTNPDLVAISFSLNCQEIQQLSQLSSQQVNLFANSLKHKRLGEIRKLLPLSSKAWKKEFNTRFWQYSETYLPTGNKKHLQDAIAFSQLLLQQLTTNNTQSLWLSDILRYEQNRLTMMEGKKLFICDRFNYNLKSLINDISQDSPSVPNPQPNFGIWIKLPNRQWRSFFIFIPIPFRKKTKHSFWKMVQKYLPSFS